jgi:branched-chain amino acid transport system substrate-binding protein
MNTEKYTFAPDLIVEVTNGCNMICKGCYAPNVLVTDNNKSKNTAIHLSLDKLKHNWASDNKIKIVSVRGGEPSINPQLPEILEFLTSKVETVYLETNGTWILENTKLLESVVKTKTCVKLSIDKMHTSKENKFEEWLEKLSSVGANVCVAITESTSENFQQTFSEQLMDFKGEVFWHKKATRANDLIKPSIGVINVHGALQESVSSKFKVKPLATSMVFLFLFILNFHLPTKAEQKITIGIAANFSTMSDSTSNPYSNYFRNAINLAIEDNKEALKKRGIDLKIREFDYSDDKMKVLQTANDAAKSDVLGVIGYIYSSDVFLAAPTFEKNKLLLLTPTGSADRIEQLGRYIRRSCYEDSFQGKALANYVFNKKNVKKIAIISVSDCAYCQSLRMAFKNQFEVAGGKVLLDSSVLSTDTSFPEIITQLKSKKVDAILIPNYEKISATIIAALADNNINPKYWLGGDGWGDSLDLFHSIVKLREYKALTISHWHAAIKSPKSKAFIEEYIKRYNKNPVDTAVLAYDSAALMIKALLNAKDLTREGLINSIELITNFDGVTGHMNYLAKRRTPNKQAVILSHQSGQFNLESIVGE